LSFIILRWFFLLPEKYILFGRFRTNVVLVVKIPRIKTNVEIYVKMEKDKKI